jgi:hypothetical protein
MSDLWAARDPSAGVFFSYIECNHAEPDAREENAYRKPASSAAPESAFLSG